MVGNGFDRIPEIVSDRKARGQLTRIIPVKPPEGLNGHPLSHSSQSTA
jgi:hypothetical protein